MQTKTHTVARPPSNKLERVGRFMTFLRIKTTRVNLRRNESYRPVAC